ncbi:MAG: hypothetical protein ABIR39_12585 [Nocardioides sp.]|uniref:hypothetical protein n=1 Tax=Nocardioides sp. TaxID=35761 RepID=UPI003266BD01
MSATREAPPIVVRRNAGVATVAAVVAVAYVAFVGARLAVLDGDPSGFTLGYDGLAYYRLALDPLTDDVSAHGITFTRPAYWQTRIGYPLSAWAVSGGQAPLVPLALLLVNLLAVVALAAMAARLARNLGRSPWWGAVPALWAGYVVGIGQDLTEPLAGALLLGSLVAIRGGRSAAAAVALTAAALTRETTLVVAVAVLLAAIVTRKPPWWVGAAPLAIYAGWRAWVRARWSGEVPHPRSDNPLAAPLTALAKYLGHAATHLGTEWPNLVLLLPTLAALGLAVAALRHRDGPPYERLALAGFLALLLCLPVWDRGQAYLRWGCEPMLLTWMLLLGRRMHALGALTGLLWVVTAAQSLGYPVWGGVWTWS